MIATSRSDEPHEAFLPYKWQQAPRTGSSFERIDLNHDLDGLESAAGSASGRRMS